MKLDFLSLPPAERGLYIDQAATRRNLSPVVMEKDFWVCWLLGILFKSDQQPAGRHAVRQWLAEALPVAFPDWKCEVVAL